MDDVRTFAPQEADQLDQPPEIAQRADRAAHMFKRDVAGPRISRSLAKGAHPVCRKDDVEAIGERREERRDVRLSSADLRERDHQHDPRAPRA